MIAGVIGAQKPQFDIWGHTVNLASRMDTHGEMGRIHVTPEAAEALLNCGYQIKSRGRIRVKGVRHEMETFYVISPNEMINSTISAQDGMISRL